MRYLIFLSFVLFNLTVFGQSREIDFKEIEELKVNSGIPIHVYASDSNRAIITGARKNDVIAKYKDGNLKLSIDVDGLLKEYDVKIDLYLDTSNLRLIDLNQGSPLVFMDEFSGDFIELRAQEGASFKGDLDFDQVKVKGTSGGIFDLRGNSNVLNVNCNLGANFKGDDLVSKNGSVVSSSGAICTVYVLNVLDARVNVGGTIKYIGKPDVLNEKKVLGGTIESKY